MSAVALSLGVIDPLETGSRSRALTQARAIPRRRRDAARDSLEVLLLGRRRLQPDSTGQDTDRNGGFKPFPEPKSLLRKGAYRNRTRCKRLCRRVCESRFPLGQAVWLNRATGCATGGRLSVDQCRAAQALRDLRGRWRPHRGGR